MTYVSNVGIRHPGAAVVAARREAPALTLDEAQRRRRIAAYPTSASPPSGKTTPKTPAKGPEKPQEKAAAPVRDGWMPLPMQFGVSAAMRFAYGLTIGPVIRNNTERLLGNEVDEPYKPTKTPGFLARELTYGIGTSYMDIALMKAMLKRAGNATSDNLLTSAGGSVGANAAVAAGATVAQAAAAARSMLFRNLVGTGALALFDAMWGAKIGGVIESAVNKILGVKKQSTTSTDIKSNTAMSTVKQTPEQTARLFARSFVATTSYTLIWQTLGSVIAKAAFTAVGGPAGAILGAFAGAAICTLGNHAVLWAIGDAASDLSQGAMRLIEKVLGMPLDKKTPDDAVPKIGDRASIAVETALIPFATALLAGMLPSYMKSLVPK